jgi:hypothetical protein
MWLFAASHHGPQKIFSAATRQRQDWCPHFLASVLISTSSAIGCAARLREVRSSRLQLDVAPRSCKNLIRMTDADIAGIPPPGEVHRTTRNKISRAGKLFAVACLPIIGAAMYYSPTLTSLGWHVIHGRTIEYRGLHVNVPIGWTVDLNLMKEDYPANPQGVTLQKPPKTLNIESRGPELMYINLLLPDAQSTPQQQAAQWNDLFRQSHPAKDFNVEALGNLPAGIDCLQALPRANITGAEAGAALACVSLRGGWLANYAGARGNVASFLQVIQQLKPKS